MAKPRRKRGPNRRVPRKSVGYLLLGIAGLAVGVSVVSLVARRKEKTWADDAFAAYQEGAPQEGLTIVYPLDGTLFPPEIIPPTFRWEDERLESNAWAVAVEFEDGEDPVQAACLDTQWAPSQQQWEVIKRRSLEKRAKVTVLGVNRVTPGTILSSGSASFKTSEDEVGAPLFFREVNLPFEEAVKDPAEHIRWRFGPISCQEPPPIVLEKLPVCGNCHSFSADGTTLAMEVDSGNDKGSYAITPVESEIVLDKSRVITWSDYKREDNEKTFGLLCQVSPDGRYVVGTVKDRALAVYRPELAFSQLFFLVKGILAIYDRELGTFNALPGADDKRYVQTNGTWSPDGKYIVFARSEVYDPESLRHVNSILVPQEEADEFVTKGRKFLYDLYRIPFNAGKGGKAEPLEGASRNGMSNYFAKYSPDGKWIVFCKAKSFMLLQPDSQLYIIPAEGGTARKLRCNTRRMNSWHSWSPNGRWLVFSSKANTVYTQLFLTHIDEQGQSSPAVVLSHFTSENRAANIPEFVNAKADAITWIHKRFLDDISYFRAAAEFLRSDDYQGAVRSCQKALEFDPNNVDVLVTLGICLLRLGRPDEAKAHLVKAIELEPDSESAHCNLAAVLAEQLKYREAIAHCREALRVDPEYSAAHRVLGASLLEVGRVQEGKKHLGEAIRLDPDDFLAACRLGDVLLDEGEHDQAVSLYRRVLQHAPDFAPAVLGLASIQAMSQDETLRNGEEAVRLATRACELTRHQDPMALDVLGAAYAEAGRFPEAISAAQQAFKIVRAGGGDAYATAILRRMRLYKQHRPFRHSASSAARDNGKPSAASSLPR